MDFLFSDEQQMLQDTVRRYLADHYDFAARRRILASPEGYSRTTWRELAGLGLLALMVPEQYGGSGGGIIETLAVVTALGEVLVVEPYLASAVVATCVIAQLGSAWQRSEWFPALASGATIAVLACDAASGGEAAPTVRADVDSDGWRLTGVVPVVYHAPAADLILVAASTSASHGEPDAVFALEPRTSGLKLSRYSTVDGQIAADVVLADVSASRSSRLGGNATAALRKILDFGVVALCAEALGALDKCLALTVDHTRTRKQFGGPIGRYQALQHRMVDMSIKIEQARSLVCAAASHCEGADEVARERVVSAAKVLIGDAARFVGQQAVQLHGAMGVSDEAGVSHYFKRLLATEYRYGSSSSHLSRYTGYMQVNE